MKGVNIVLYLCITNFIRC